MNQTNKFLLTLIIPVYNEFDNIPTLVKSLNIFFETLTEADVEVLFINDGSQDQTEQALLAEKHISYKARVINLSRNFGSHAAIRAGILHAKGDLISFNYADIQDPLELIIDLKRKIDEGNDIVWAHRENTSTPLSQKIFSRLYAMLMKYFAFKNFPENGFDICIFNRKVANEVNKNIEANSSIFLQILGLGFRQTSISYKKRERKIGKSKWTLSRKIKLLIDSFVAFSYAPIRFVTIVGIIMFVIGVFLSIYIILRTLIFHDLAAGWPALFSILMLGFGVTNISLGILAEYLWRTLDASRKRPVFIIDKILDLNI